LTSALAAVAPQVEQFRDIANQNPKAPRPLNEAQGFDGVAIETAVSGLAAMRRRDQADTFKHSQTWIE
jgi:hypothetical protein